MSFYRFLALCLALAFAFAGASYGYERNDVKSCYRHARINDNGAADPQRELFIIVDQTTIPDVNLKRSAHEKVHRFLDRGDAFKIAIFSAYIGKHYADLVLAGRLDTPLSQNDLDDTPDAQRQAFERCMGSQTGHVRELIDERLKHAFGNEVTHAPKTELMSNFQRISRDIVQPSKAKKKVVLIVSDMLENSNTTSFYEGNRVRRIDPAAEMERIVRKDLLSDFSGADIYIMGAGLLPPGDLDSADRGDAAMNTIRRFWEDYFTESNAKLVAFGQPELMRDLD